MINEGNKQKKAEPNDPALEERDEPFSVMLRTMLQAHLLELLGIVTPYADLTYFGLMVIFF